MTERDAPRIVVDTRELLADLAAFWADEPLPLSFSGNPPRKIAGTVHDQPVPLGTQNPYWEIVRQLPLNDMPVLWQTGPEPTLYWLAERSSLRRTRYFSDRFDVCATYSWAVCTPGDIDWMKDILDGRGVVECGAGTGYWAWQLRQAGVDVIAYDPLEAGTDNGFARREWSVILRDDHSASKHHPDRALFLCWPSYGEPWAAQSLACYEGDLLFFCGEDEGGCTADDNFFRLLEAGWEEIASCPSHISYWGIHDELRAYRRIRGPRVVLSWG